MTGNAGLITIENAVASERDGDIFIMIPQALALPLERMAVTVIEQELILFARPGSPKKGWSIKGLDPVPLLRLRQQKMLIVAEVSKNNTLSRIIELPRY